MGLQATRPRPTRLEALALQLERSHPGAAASLREGLAETVTVNPGISGSLRRTLSSTNPCESMTEQSRIGELESGLASLVFAYAPQLLAESGRGPLTPRR